MTNYLYKHSDNLNSYPDENSELTAYCKKHALTQTKLLEDDDPIKLHWSDRPIGDILIQQAKKGDNIIVYDPSSLACSISQILEILTKACDHQVNLHFVKYDATIDNSKNVIKTRFILELIGKIETDFISKRTSQALARRRAAGLPLGRPKGRGNKSLKLDKHKEEILKYLSLGISKASIAKLVDCHPQTLYDWLERKNIQAPVK